jgi:hypothetical protein
VARLLSDAAEGLHAAHHLPGSDGKSLNVVHRDVSPHNIFVTYDGVAKVVDFGIARARERSSSTEAGAFKGKFEYASPEQITGDPVDLRSDIWALGVCLWELLTGQRLFKREDFSATARAVMRDPIPPPSSLRDDVPPEFDAIIERALAREPEARFQSAREFGRALREVLARSGTAIDGPTIEEWLEATFPGDRARRQALSAAVRQSGPDAPLEAVPAALKVSDTNTGSKPRMPAVVPKRAKPPPPPADMTAPGAARVDASTRQSPALQPKDEDEYPKTVVDPVKPSSSGAMLFLVLGGLVAVIGVGLAVLLWPAAPEVAPSVSLGVDAGGERAVEVVEQAPVVVPPVAADETAVVDAGNDLVVAEVVDAGLAESSSAHAVRKPAKPKVTTPPPVQPTTAMVKPPTPVASSRGGGRVHFKTPGGVADVYVDGVKAGATPVSVDLSPGKHAFELRAKGVEFGGPSSLNVSPGSDFDVEVDLR